MTDTLSLLEETSLLLQHASIQIDFTPLYDNGKFFDNELSIRMDTYVSQYGVRVIKHKAIKLKTDKPTNDQLNNLIIELTEEVREQFIKLLSDKIKEFKGKAQTFQQEAKKHQKMLKNIKPLLENLSKTF